jgi:hypothetical protein
MFYPIFGNAREAIKIQKRRNRASAPKVESKIRNNRRLIDNRLKSVITHVMSQLPEEESLPPFFTIETLKDAVLRYIRDEQKEIKLRGLTGAERSAAVGDITKDCSQYIANEISDQDLAGICRVAARQVSLKENWRSKLRKEIQDLKDPKALKDLKDCAKSELGKLISIINAEILQPKRSSNYVNSPAEASFFDDFLNERLTRIDKPNFLEASPLLIILDDLNYLVTNFAVPLNVVDGLYQALNAVSKELEAISAAEPAAKKMRASDPAEPVAEASIGGSYTISEVDEAALLLCGISQRASAAQDAPAMPLEQASSETPSPTFGIRSLARPATASATTPSEKSKTDGNGGRWR